MQRQQGGYQDGEQFSIGVEAVVCLDDMQLANTDRIQPRLRSETKNPGRLDSGKGRVEHRQKTTTRANDTPSSRYRLCLVDVVVHQEVNTSFFGHSRCTE